MEQSSLSWDLHHQIEGNKTDNNGHKVSVWYRPLLFNVTLCRIEVSSFQIESLKVTIVYLERGVPNSAQGIEQLRNSVP